MITRPVRSGSVPLKNNLHSLALIPTAWMLITCHRISPFVHPYQGYIDKISAHDGNQISAGETIFMLVKKYEPVIAFELPEEFYPKLKTGNQIEFFFPGDSLVLYKARLTFINRQTDASNHLIKAWAIPLKSSSRLVPGMQVSLRLPL